jgi:hypothetical protein
MERKFAWISVCVLLCAVWLAGACLDPNNVYVDAGASGPGMGTPEAPFSKIATGLFWAAFGGTVHVAEGEYHENLVVRKPLTLQGAGSDRTLLVCDMAWNGIEIQADDVAVSGFSIVGEGSPSPEEVPVAGLYARYADNLTIRDNEIGPYSGWGLAVGNGSGIQIENNLVQFITDQPAFLYDATGISVHMVNGSVGDNTSSHNVHGMFVSGERGNEFSLSLTGNLIEDNDYWGVIFADAYLISDFSNNRILGNGGPGLSAFDVGAWVACHIAGGGGSDCEEPTTEIGVCENNVIGGNNPDFDWGFGYLPGCMDPP